MSSTFRMEVIKIKYKTRWNLLIALGLFLLALLSTVFSSHDERTSNESAATTVPKLSLANMNPSGRVYKLEEIQNNSDLDLVLGASVCNGVIGMVGLSFHEDLGTVSKTPMMAACYHNHTIEKLTCAMPPTAVAREIVCIPDMTYCILEQQITTNKWLLAGYNRLGRNVLEQDISAFVPDGTELIGLGYLLSGHLLLVLQHSAIVFDLEGAIQAVLKFSGCNVGVFTNNFEELILKNYGDDGITLYKIREDDWTAESWLKFSNSYSYYTFISGGSSEYSFFFYNSQHLCGYKESDNTQTEMFAFEDIGISSAMIETILCIDKEQFFIAYWNSKTEKDDFYRAI